MQENKTEFIKADKDKAEWTLMPFEQLEKVVEVLQMGAKKYSADNWQKCDDPKRYENALMRHVVSYLEGKKTDDESGITHLAHAICNCLFLMWFDEQEKKNGEGKDSGRRV